MLMAGLVLSVSAQEEAKPSPIASKLVGSIKQIAKSGGRLDWFHGADHDLIVFDAGTGRSKSEVFTMRPDGSKRRCITRGLKNLPEGYRGQPAWHPDGKHIVIQVENEHSKGSLYNHMAWGINADLWLIDKGGKRAERMWTSKEHHGALHAHFDPAGTRLVFSERIATGRVLTRLTIPLGAGGENQWTGWCVHVANVDLKKSGAAILSNHRQLFKDKPGFYETHGFSPRGDLVFSHTRGGRPYVDDIYTAPVKGGAWRPLVASPSTWDEHAQFSPSGNAIAFISSRHDPNWKTPKSKADTLNTELYLKTKTGVEQLTRFNEIREQRVMLSDLSWSREGKRIAFLVTPVAKRLVDASPPEIWMLEFAD